MAFLSPNVEQLFLRWLPKLQTSAFADRHRRQRHNVGIYASTLRRRIKCYRVIHGNCVARKRMILILSSPFCG